MPGVPDPPPPQNQSPSQSGSTSSTTPQSPSTPPPIVKDYYGNVVADPSKPYVTGVTTIQGPKGNGSYVRLQYSTGETGSITSPSGNATPGKDVQSPGTINSYSKAFDDAAKSGIIYKSAGVGDNGSSATGGMSARDQYVGEALHDYLSSQGKNGAQSKEQLSSTLGKVGLSLDPSTGTITDPLQTQNIERARENSTKGGYAGLGSGGPETPQSAGRNEGQAAHNYTQDNYSPEQYATSVSAVKTNQEYGNNTNFLSGNIGTENSTGPSPIPTANKNSPPPDLSNKQSELLGAGLLALSKAEGKTPVTVESLTTKINSDIQQRNDAIALQNEQMNQLGLQTYLNEKVNAGLANLAFASSLVQQAKDNGAQSIEVARITTVNSDGVVVSNSHPLESIPIGKANSRIDELIRNEKNPESLSFSYKPVIASPGPGATLEFTKPDPVENVIGRPSVALLDLLSNTVIQTGVGLAALPFQFQKEISDIVSGKENPLNIPATIAKGPTPIPEGMRSFENENIPADPLGAGIGGLIVGKGLTGFKSDLGPEFDLPYIGAGIAGMALMIPKEVLPFRFTRAVIEEGQGLNQDQHIYSAVTVGYKEGGSGYILAGKAPNGPIIFGTPKPEAYLPEKYDINLGGRGFTGSEGGGLLNKLLNSDKVMDYYQENNILTHHDVELFKAVRDATPVVVKAPVTVFHSTFGEQPLDTVLSGAETSALKDIIKTGQKEKDLGPQYGSFADVPFVPGKVNVGDLDLAVNSAEHQKEIGLFAEQKLNEAVGNRVSLTTDSTLISTGESDILATSYHGADFDDARELVNNGVRNEGTLFTTKSVGEALSYADEDLSNAAIVKITYKKNTLLDLNNLSSQDSERLDALYNQIVKDTGGLERGTHAHNLAVEQLVKEKGKFGYLGERENSKDPYWVGITDKRAVDNLELVSEQKEIDELKDLTGRNDKEIIRPATKRAIKEPLPEPPNKDRLFKFEEGAVFLYQEGQRTKIIDLPIKGQNEEGGQLESLTTSHQVFGVEEPKEVYNIEGISTKTPHYNTVRRSTTLTRIGSKDMKSAIPGFGYTTKHGNYVGPEIGRLKDAARTYRGYILAAKAFREKGNNKAADLLENSALTIKNRFQHRYNFKEALYEIRGETVFNTRPEESELEASSVSKSLLVVKESPFVNNQKKESIAKEEPIYNIKSANRSRSRLEPRSAAKSAYRGSASKSAYKEASTSRLNSLVNKGSSKSPALTASRNISPRSSSVSTESPSTTSLSNSPSLVPKSPSLSTPGITNSPPIITHFNTGSNPLTSKLETNPLTEMINSKETPMEIILPDLVNKTTKGINPKPKPRADFLGNTSESQVEGLYNRSETVYGQNRINKLRSKDNSIVTKGLGHLVSKKKANVGQKNQGNVNKLLGGKTKKLRL